MIPPMTIRSLVSNNAPHRTALRWAVSAIIAGCTLAAANDAFAQRSGRGQVYQSRVAQAFRQTPGDYVVTYNEVDAMYAENAKKPLGGLFAKGFTRTLTVMGGWNYLPNELSSTDASAENDSPNGYAISAAMGRRHSRTLRSEIEFAIRGNDFEMAQALTPTFGSMEADLNVYSLMKNFFLEYDNSSIFTPYGGAGIGLSYAEIDGNRRTTLTQNAFSDGDTAFTFQAIAGVATQINKASDFVVEYRYLRTSDLEFDDVNSNMQYDANNLFMGLKIEY